jgi:DNA helicase HerA-like ATPase
LQVFGRPDNTSVCECERVQSSSLAQSLQLINSNEIKAKLAVANGRALRLAAADTTAQDKITELYLVAFSRHPRPDEMEKALAYLAEPVRNAAGDVIDQKAATQQNLQDLIWALINTKEFLFNH